MRWAYCWRAIARPSAGKLPLATLDKNTLIQLLYSLGLEQRDAERVAERILGFTSDLKTLESFLPICTYCKKVRNDSDYWQEIEAYLHQETGTDFSHGICPDCFPIALRGLDELAARVPSPGGRV